MIHIKSGNFSPNSFILSTIKKLEIGFSEISFDFANNSKNIALTIIKHRVNLDPEKRINILDIGIGTASYYVELMQKCQNIHLTGIDQHTSTINVAKDVLREFGSRVILYNKDFKDLENLKSFDIIVSLSVIEHIRNLHYYSNYIAGKLKDDGFAIVGQDWGHFNQGIWLRMLLKQASLFNRFFPSKFQYYKDYSFKEVDNTINSAGLIILHEIFCNLGAISYIVKKSVSKDLILSQFLKDWIKFDCQLSSLVKHIQLNNETREKIIRDCSSSRLLFLSKVNERNPTNSFSYVG